MAGAHPRLDLALACERGYAWQRFPFRGGAVHVKGNEWDAVASVRGWLAEPELDAETLVRRAGDLPCPCTLVVEGENELWASVDRLRTQPLFYAASPARLALTDDPYSPAAGVELTATNEVAAAEFQLCGYVTGPETLSQGLSGLQAGEFLHARARDGKVEWRLGRAPSTFDRPADPAAMGAVACDSTLALFDEIFAPLCAVLRTRQTVLPLSSGVDSRFVAAMLKRHGVRDVLAFTYGRPENWEVAASRATAAQLGFDWHFVPYSRRAWRDWYASPEMTRYLPFCARHVATPHVQDWPAVCELKRRNLIAGGAVVVPGHTAFLTSADRLERRVAGLEPERRVAALAKLIYRHNYTLQAAARVGATESAMEQRIAGLIDPAAGSDMHRLLNAFFAFEAAERHAKLIVNSVRVYEFWGMTWALPLWDDRLVRLWAGVPYDARLGKGRFREFAERVNLYGLFPQAGPPGLSDQLLRAAKARRWAYVTLRQMRCLEERLFGYFHHFLAWYGIVGYPAYVYHMGRCGNVYSLLSRLYLRRLEGDLTERST